MSNKPIRSRAGTFAIIVLTLAMTPLGGADANAAAESQLGVVTFQTSCDPAVRPAFERGVALLHHMMYVESRATFEGVAERDPACAMARWGVAMTLFQPLWPTRPDSAALIRGWTLVQQARTVASTTDREAAFIDAVGAFFREPEDADYWTRIRRFEEGMSRVHQAYPEDAEAAAFYALAHLATAPQADDPMVHHEAAAAILLDIYAAEPTHPGAIHYTIHANDLDGREAQSLHVVRSYAAIAPSVPHALHMPTHIFVRLGAWPDVIEWNRRSAEAALRFSTGSTTSHHYPHALDYLVYAHLQRGEDGLAQQLLEVAHRRGDYQDTFISAYHLAAIPARLAVERRQWTEAAALAPWDRQRVSWERFPWPASLTVFARGLGAARLGDLDGARAAIVQLDALRATAHAADEEYFATQIEISRLAVAAWLAHGEGHADEAIRLMRSAVELEHRTDKHPVTPGALVPASELLGDLLLEQGRAAAALAAYDTALRFWPRRFNAVLGAARAAAAAGDRGEANSRYNTLLDIAGRPSGPRRGLTEARAYLRTETDGQ